MSETVKTLKWVLESGVQKAKQSGRTIRMLEVVVKRILLLAPDKPATCLIVIPTMSMADYFKPLLYQKLEKEGSISIVSNQGNTIVVNGHIRIMFVTPVKSQGVCSSYLILRFVDHSVEEQMIAEGLNRIATDIEFLKGER